MAKKQRKTGRHKVSKHTDRLVEVTWVDATGHSGWMDRNIAITRKPITMRTAGYVLEETDTYVKIVRTVELDADTNDIGDVFIIPRDWVQKIKRH